MPEIGDIKDGLKTRLETISGLQVFDYVPEGTLALPSATIAFVRRERATLGRDYRYRFLIILRLGGANAQEQWDDLDNYLSPTGTKSIQAAIAGGPTLAGVADLAEVPDSGMEMVERTQTPNGWFYRGEIPVDVYK